VSATAIGGRTGGYVTSWLEINLARLENNYRFFRNRIGSSVSLCGVVKADAYGLGAVPIAKELVRLGVDFLAVYSVAQAAVLEREGIKSSLMVLMPIHSVSEFNGMHEALADQRIHLTLHDLQQIDVIQQLAQQVGVPVPVHLHLDTGMSRGGLNTSQLEKALHLIAQSDMVRIAGVGTHFAGADDDAVFSKEQLRRLSHAMDSYRKNLPPDLLVHAANTFGVLRDHCFHQAMVRIGLGLYGYGPRLMPDLGREAQTDLQPVVTWRSQIIHLQSYDHGTPVGYNSTHLLTRPSRLGLVPVGYADGYPLALGGKSGVVVWADHKSSFVAPVLGKVNMDQIVIDVTDFPGEIDKGTAVELISCDPNSPCALERLAEQAGSSCYEMLCRLSERIPRHYDESPHETGI